ncbi:hypothetical protein BC936DRAFT_137021 [Jimgerdemannia flammicorona]|uniref:Uncharacterized protein n=1 Tax=Jimgerdemannia flammicorona TaxID=994334 RepID=A0A433CY84_9FUNG|nr:hypothetical protein BC936DRAFT_137021 [Jimgerdemannia flammicorona]
MSPVTTNEYGVSLSSLNQEIVVSDMFENRVQYQISKADPPIFFPQPGPHSPKIQILNIPTNFLNHLLNRRARELATPLQRPHERQVKRSARARIVRHAGVVLVVRAGFYGRRLARLLLVDDRLQSGSGGLIGNFLRRSIVGNLLRRSLVGNLRCSLISQLLRRGLVGKLLHRGLVGKLLRRGLVGKLLRCGLVGKLLRRGLIGKFLLRRSLLSNLLRRGLVGNLLRRGLVGNLLRRGFVGDFLRLVSGILENDTAHGLVVADRCLRPAVWRVASSDVGGGPGLCDLARGDPSRGGYKEEESEAGEKLCPGENAPWEDVL